jgi:hypothetical protein
MHSHFLGLQLLCPDMKKSQDPSRVGIPTLHQLTSTEVWYIIGRKINIPRVLSEKIYIPSILKIRFWYHLNLLPVEKSR